MDRIMVEFLYKPGLKNPFLIEGLPGIGDVGLNVAKTLISEFRARPFARIISSFLPDIVVVEDGICRLPTYVFYATKEVKPNLIILTGDVQPPRDNTVAHYELCESVIELALRLGVKAVVSVGGFLMPTPSEDVFVAYGSRALAEKFLTAGAKLLPPTHIVGATGLIPAMAADRGLEAVCLLGACSTPVNDRGASARTLRVLSRALGLGREGLSKAPRPST